MRCVHCRRQLTKRKASRGLCWPCYRKPAVLALHPPKLVTKPTLEMKAGRKAVRKFEDDPPQPGDPSPEEVAAFAAWWAAEEERLSRRPEALRVFRVVEV